MKYLAEKVYINFDESGNFGTDGRYFTIAGIISYDSNKPLSNVIKRTVLKTKKQFVKYSNYAEIKASESFPCIKDFFLQKIVSKDIFIRYVVADLHHTKKSLIDDENVLYNYLLQFIILPEARKPGVKKIIINLDKRSVKVNSVNSFEDYIKIKIVAELNLDIEIVVKYLESHNCYPVQAADFVANAINSYYEKNNIYYYSIIKSKVIQSEKFPRNLFGT